MGKGRAAMITIALVAASADAQPGTAYTPEQFERFSPLTALDMVREIPGFSIQQGGAGGRGLGQASGNVLINGQRVSGKSNSAGEALARMPIGKVLRMELGEASDHAIPGLSGQVVNVITRPGGISGTWSWDPRFRQRLEPRLSRASVSVNGELGSLAWTLGLENDANNFGGKGAELITSADGLLRERRNEDVERSVEDVEASLALDWSGDNGHRASLNASARQRNENERERSLRQPVDGDRVQRRFLDGEDEWDSEVGADYSLPFAQGRVKFIALVQYEDASARDIRVDRDAADMAFLESEQLDEDSTEGETIGRLEYSWIPQADRNWQIALETARNSLDFETVRADLTETGLASITERDPETQVRETRHEASLTHGRPVLSGSLRLEISLGAEYAEITSQAREVSLSSAFFLPRGYVQAEWDPSATNTVTIRLERTVGQLDFDDFVGSRDINDGRDSAGNRELVPDRTWRLETRLDREIGKKSAVNLTVFHEEIEDLIDRVPLGEGRDGPGNIDDARRTGFELNSTIGLERWLADGLQWDLDLEWQQARVEDPLTGERRAISRSLVSFYSTELRWDIPETPYAVRVGGERRLRAPRFRSDETSSSALSRPFLWVEARHKDLFGINTFVRVTNLLDARDIDERVIFAPDRLGQVDERRESSRAFGPFLQFGFSGAF